MTAISTEFIGGPCDGQTKRLADDVLRAGAVSCGGANYIIQGIRPNLYRATYAKDVAAQEQVTPTGGHAQFDHAWAKLMRTLAFTMPGTTHSVEKSVRRIRRAVR